MSGNINIANTEEARNCCATLDAGVVYYEKLISELTNSKNKMQANWEGDSAALNDVIARIDAVVNVLSAKLVPSMKTLSTSVVKFADEIDKVSSNTIENNTSTNGTIADKVGQAGIDAATSVGTATDTKKTEKVGFWEFHGGNFAEAWTSQNWGEAWDYSGCDSGLDYVTTTVDSIIDSAGNVVDGLVDTAGAIVNFVGDGVCELIGWLF